MPLQFERTLDHGVYIEASGEVSAKELLSINQKIYEQLNLIDWIKYQILDLSKVTHAHFTVNDIKDMAEQDVVASNHNPNMIIAIVGTKSLYQSITKVWQSYTKIADLESKLFEDRVEAEKWIREKIKP